MGKVQVHQKTSSSKTTFIKNHFHQKTTFIKKPLQNHFHQKPNSSETFIKNPIQKHFHQKPISSKTTFNKNQFHEKPFSSEKRTRKGVGNRRSQNNIVTANAHFWGLCWLFCSASRQCSAESGLRVQRWGFRVFGVFGGLGFRV